MENISIKITGGGSPAEVAGALRQIAKDIEAGEHVTKLQGTGECEWEDSSLMTTITEEVW